MIQTRVGYAGSAEPKPTYHDLRGHAEVVRVVYEPAHCSYADLLTQYAEWHRPRRSEGQYRSLLSWSTPEERALAEAYTESQEVAPQLVNPGTLEGRWWDAEDYHQKHRLRRHKDIVAVLEDAYGPRWDEHGLSTKLNAFGRDFDPAPYAAILPDELRPLLGVAPGSG